MKKHAHLIQINQKNLNNKLYQKNLNNKLQTLKNLLIGS